MESSYYTTAKALFGEVCDLPKAAQSGRLQELTDDVALIAYVQNLLRQDYTHHPRIAGSVLAGLNAAAVEDLKVGQVLGVWKLIEEIGQGGMGQVFRAKRVDGHFEQTAAVKFLHGIPSAKALEYLARERQILAGLAHPNIARLYDGGATPQGQPYLVMEYIEGVSIDRYARNAQLSRAATLRLVIDVCSAVSFAHQRLIVHCDLKPSNIMVTPAGRPMLLDFGIARLLEVGEETDAVPAAAFSAEIRASRDPDSRGTQTKARAFTPKYASPEQRSGGSLTTATDVFSLGKMLEELLVNALEKPNNRTSSVIEMDTKLPSELHALIAKATATNAAARYATASELSIEIERYLKREPLMALPKTIRYLSFKFSQRNWPWMLVAGVFSVMGLFAVRQIVSERNLALAAEAKTKVQAEKSLRTGNFMVSLFESADPNKAGAPVTTAMDLLAVGRERLSELSADQHEFRTSTLLRLGKIHENIGMFDEAIKIYHEVIQLEKAIPKPSAENLECYAKALDWLAVIENNNGRPALAEAPARESLAVRQRLLSSLVPGKQDLKNASLSVADAQGALGIVLTSLRRRDEARNMLLAALQTRESLLGTFSDEVGSTTNNLGMLHAAFGEFAEAEKYYLQSIKIKRKIYDDPNQPKLLNTLMNLGTLFSEQRRFAESEPLLRNAYTARKKAHGLKSEKVATATYFLALSLQNMGRYREAQQLYIEANGNPARAANLHGSRPVVVAITLNAMGSLLEEIGDTQAALLSYREALSITTAQLSHDDLAAVTIENNLGRLRTKMGELSEAEALLNHAYSVRVARLTAVHVDSQETLINLAALAVKAENFGLSQERSSQINEAALKSRPTLVLEKMALAAQLMQPVNIAEAQKMWRSRSDFAKHVFGETHLIYWRTQLDLAQFLRLSGSAADRMMARQLAQKIAPQMLMVLAKSAVEREQLALLL